MSTFSSFISSLGSISSSVSSEDANSPVPDTPTCTPVSFDTIKGALESKGLSVKWFQELFIVTYPKSRNTPNPTVDYSDPLVRECRGLIVNKNSPYNVICKGFDRFDDVTTLSQDILRHPSTQVTNIIDGTYVKLYYDTSKGPEKSKWCLATNRCIDAKKARWSSFKTFFDYFQEASNSENSILDYALLDTKHTYLFVVCHPESRIVRCYTTPMIYHVGTYDTSSAGCPEIDEDINIPKPPVVDTTKYESLSQLVEYTNTLDWQDPGFVVKWTDDAGTPHRSKIRNSKYESVNALRGNNPNVALHYLNLRSDTENPQPFMEFTKYFPEYGMIEDSINMLARYLHQLYMSYYVNKTIQVVPDRISWKILSQLHTSYIRSRVPTTLDVVQNIVRSLPNEELAKLLRL